MKVTVTYHIDADDADGVRLVATADGERTGFVNLLDPDIYDEPKTHAMCIKDTVDGIRQAIDALEARAHELEVASFARTH